MSKPHNKYLTLPYPNPKNSPIGPKKLNKTLKISSISKLQKKKIDSQTQKIARWSPKRVTMTLKRKKKKSLRLKIKKSYTMKLISLDA